jgi:hypothetical protein
MLKEIIFPPSGMVRLVSDYHYNDGDETYEGWKLDPDKMIYAVGRTPKEAIVAFCKERWNSKLEKIGEALEPNHNGFDWGYRFILDGTSFKAAGVNIPGGAVLTWWK